MEVGRLPAAVGHAPQGRTPEVTLGAGGPLGGRDGVVQAQHHVADDPDVRAPTDAVLVKPDLGVALVGGGGGGRGAIVGALLPLPLALVAAAQYELHGQVLRGVLDRRSEGGGPGTAFRRGAFKDVASDVVGAEQVTHLAPVAAFLAKDANPRLVDCARIVPGNEKKVTVREMFDSLVRDPSVAPKF